MNNTLIKLVQGIIEDLGKEPLTENTSAAVCKCSKLLELLCSMGY